MAADLSPESLQINNPMDGLEATPFVPENVQVIENDPAKPRYLTHDEILASAVKDLSIDQHSGYQGSIERASLDQFIKESVTGVRMNGVDVLSVDFEHSDNSPDPYIGKFIGSDRTKLVVAEYFYPELERNLKKSPLRKHAEHLMFVDNKDRMMFAKNLADFVQRQNKPVAVADIANKPSYMAVRDIFRSSLVAAGFLGGGIGMNQNMNLAPYLLALEAGIIWDGSIFAQRKLGRGIFNKDQISKFEKLVLDFEQARRMYLARGVEQLTQEYSPKDGEERPQIVVIYPKAHGIRMADALVNPEGSLDAAKNIVYKTFGAPLNFSVRTYAWRDSLQRLGDRGYKWGQFAPIEDQDLSSDTEDKGLGESNSGWRLISNRRI